MIILKDKHTASTDGGLSSVRSSWLKAQIEFLEGQPKKDAALIKLYNAELANRALNPEAYSDFALNH